MKISADRSQQRAALPEAREAGQHRRATRSRCASGSIEAGVDSIHVSTGQLVPAPAESGRRRLSRRRPGAAPTSSWRRAARTRSGTCCSSTASSTAELFRKQWLDAGVPPDQIEGLTLPDARRDQAGGDRCRSSARAGSRPRRSSARPSRAATATASASRRPLVANNDLVNQFAAGRDRAERPCTYCNKCLVHVVEHPIGCYEESRFDEPRGDDGGGHVGVPSAGVPVSETGRRRHA